MRFAMGLVLILCATMPASAAEVAWRGVTVTYDDATWRVGDPTGPGALVFTCVAADCKGNPVVFAMAEPPPEPSAVLTRPFCRAQLDPAMASSHTLPLIDLSGGPYALPFAAVTRWSGCRAMDQPILEACAEHGDLLYRFTTRFGGGCNFDPPVPAHHFQALLRGVRPTP